MKRAYNSIAILVGSIILLSCSQSRSYEAIEKSTANDELASEALIQSDASAVSTEVNESEFSKVPIVENSSKTELKSSQPANFIASLASFWQNDDETHRFIRTAEMKFKVKEIPQATTEIENIVIRNMGFILRSSIQNETVYSNIVNISKDSALVVQHNRLTADLQLKVPYAKLDSVIREIAPFAEKIDYRIVNAQDVTLNIMAEKLRETRLNTKKKRITTAIDSRGRKLDGVMEAEQVLDNTAEQVDEAILSKYRLKEQIEYSLINIKLYQREMQFTDKIVREQSEQEYQPSLGDQAIQSLQNGWSVMCQIFIVLLNIWPLFMITLIVGIVFVIYKKKHS